MKVNIYYGGRGLIEDSTLFVIQKMMDVFEEIRVEVERFNLYEMKNEIATLPSTLKKADAIVLAANVEWFGIGGYLTQFLDACWLYGDKKRIQKICMMPVVISNTYGEREAETTLNRAWELLGGTVCPGITAFVKSQSEFETFGEYASVIEKRAEDLYRTIKQNPVRLPSSTAMLLSEKMEKAALKLTPEESEQLSKYVSDGTFVKQQKEDIEELSEMFTSLMGEGEASQEFIKNFKENFIPPRDDSKMIFKLKLNDVNKTLVLDINKDKLKVYYGDVDNADLTAITTRDILNRIVNGRQTFQGAFMTDGLKATGDFMKVRMFDQFFRFTKL